MVKAGAAACCFRQTNVVWLAFIAATAVVRSLQPRSELYDPSLSKATLRMSPRLPSKTQLTPRTGDIPLSIYSLSSHSLQNLPLLAPLFAAYIPVFVAAGAFVYWNGGIVLGALLSPVSPRPR